MGRDEEEGYARLQRDFDVLIAALRRATDLSTQSTLLRERGRQIREQSRAAVRRIGRLG